MSRAIKTHSGFLVLVDISGYTRFIMAHKLNVIPALKRRNERVAEEHAEAIISILLETVIDDLDDILVVNKLEGDAALFYALYDDPAAFAPELVTRLRRTFDAFNSKIESLRECDGCLCEACCKRGDLRIKIVAHVGEFLIKPVARFDELAGESVIFAHRLLKNDIPSKEYLVLTQAMVDLVPDLDAFHDHEQRVDDFGRVPLRVFYPTEPAVVVRRLPLPWPWQTWRMARFFATPRSRRLLEAERRVAGVGGDFGVGGVIGG
jgi:class 3 adenylate cyclase